MGISLNKKIERLKVIVINKNGIIVERINGESGFVHISEVAHGYIADLNNNFKVGDIIYGVRKKSHYGKKYYSLKTGHSMPRYIQKKYKVSETGGGYLGIIHHQQKKLDKLQRRKND